MSTDDGTITLGPWTAGQFGRDSTLSAEDRTKLPVWLRAAEVTDAVIQINQDGQVCWLRGTWNYGEWRGEYWADGTWRGGIWFGGTWNGGIWHTGIWRDGVWHGGVWQGGDWQQGMWYRGTWHDGTWYDGIWHAGTWYDGTWQRGTWHQGTWKSGRWQGGIWYAHHGACWEAPEDRLLFMAALLGIVFGPDGTAVAYRTTTAQGTGRYTRHFQQPVGEFTLDDFKPAGSGTCVPGLHVTTAAKAWTYFEVDPAARMWKVTFTREQLLDCDGEKARISGGFAEEIANPFLPNRPPVVEVVG